MNGVQETSLLAYREIKPKRGKKQLEVYNVLLEASQRGFDMTNLELARLLGWEINRVTPRVHELRHDWGDVVLSQKRKCGVTGRLAFAWKVKKLEP